MWRSSRLRTLSPLTRVTPPLPPPPLPPPPLPPPPLPSPLPSPCRRRLLRRRATQVAAEFSFGLTSTPRARPAETGNYVTPHSDSILPSITNRALQQIAVDLGLKVEKRPVSIDEFGKFGEVAACGTAVVLTPISSITHYDKVTEYGDFKQFQAFYDRVRAIQVRLRLPARPPPPPPPPARPPRPLAPARPARPPRPPHFLPQCVSAHKYTASADYTRLNSTCRSSCVCVQVRHQG